VVHLAFRQIDSEITPFDQHLGTLPNLHHKQCSLYEPGFKRLKGAGKFAKHLARCTRDHTAPY
jgi:hypothetical protein